MERYSVILKGFTRGPEWFRSRMLRHGAKIAQVEKIIAAVPCVLKAGLSFADAQRMEETFRDAGGVLELKPEGENVESAGLPLAPPPPSSPPEMDALAPSPPAAEAADADASPFMRAPRRTNPEPLSSPQAAVGFAPSAGASLDSGAPAGIELLDVAGGGAPEPTRRRTNAVSTPPPDEPPTYNPSVPSLDLLEVAPRATTPPPRAAAAASKPLPSAVGGVPITPKMGEFKTYNPWIGRGIVIGSLLFVAILLQTCVGKYKVADRLHTFSGYAANDLEQEIMQVGRKNGICTRADIIAIAKKFGEQAHVTVDVTDIIEERIDVMSAPGMIGDYGGGPASGRCSAVPPSMLTKLPMDKQMEWAQMMQTCNYPNWIIGFSAKLTARYGFSTSSAYVEHYAFVWKYTPDDELEQ